MSNWLILRYKGVTEFAANKVSLGYELVASLDDDHPILSAYNNGGAFAYSKAVFDDYCTWVVEEGGHELPAGEYLVLELDRSGVGQINRTSERVYTNEKIEDRAGVD